MKSNLTIFKSSNFHDFLCAKWSLILLSSNLQTFMTFFVQKKHLILQTSNLQTFMNFFCVWEGSILPVFKPSNFYDFFVYEKAPILPSSNLQTFMMFLHTIEGSDVTIFKSEVLPIIFHDGYFKVWKSFKMDTAYYTNQSLLSRGDKIKQVAHHANDLHLPQVQTKS
jgi:hypothetical protein